MAKKVSELEKEEIRVSFLNGETLDNLSKKYNCSKITISRHLKKNISENKYKELIKKNNLKKNESELDINKNSTSSNCNFETSNKGQSKSEKSFSESSFIEIAPLNCDIDNMPQKDLSSINISDVDFPNVVYMIVDKKIELQTKYLNEYPEWQFLSQEDLNRKTIEIYFDLNLAKRFCNKEQKVIKVPNTEVFKIASSLLLGKGISRIVSADKLISL